MKTEVKYPVAVVTVFIWIGFVCAISFMEAWLKFRAPGVTLPIGLGIGRLVFGVLNKVEIVFLLAIYAHLLTGARGLFSSNKITISLITLILMLQTFWLLPALDGRAEMLIRGQEVPASGLHLYYIVAEMVKVIALFVFGLRLFRNK